MSDDELMLTPNDGQRRRKQRSRLGAVAARLAPSPEEKLTSHSIVVRLEGTFEIAFRARFGFRPIISYGRDRKELGKLATQWGETEIAALISFFFTTMDAEIRRCRFYNVRDFAYWAPKLRRLRECGADIAPSSRRSATNAEALARATGRR